MRYQVPQFVDIEDKIIGPLTLKQFLFYLTAALLLVPVYLFSDLSLFLLIAIPMIATAAALAHVKIGGQTLPALLGKAITFFTSGQLFLWHRSARDKPLLLQGNEYIAIDPKTLDVPPTLRDHLRDLETHGNIVTTDTTDPLTTQT